MLAIPAKGRRPAENPYMLTLSGYSPSISRWISRVALMPNWVRVRL